MRRVRVRIGPEASEQAREIDRWWRENRPVAAELFTGELFEALSTLAVAAQAGTPYPYLGVPGVRRLLLRASRYHLYYRVRDDDLYVIAIWSAIRGAEPDLSALHED